MRTYWNTENHLQAINEWQPNCWIQVTCPTDEDQRLLEEETTLRINLADVTAQGNSLDEQIARVGTNSYVESRARQDYQYIKPGELRFEFVNPEELYAYTEEEARIRQEAMED